ncbi:MAG: hypothetical protein HYX90_10790 [Chloroflexi bacterium]|nr:hypothetical protein [Chloroflexota bacterium]
MIGRTRLPLDPETAAQINLGLQIALTATVLGAVYAVRFRYKVNAHCAILRVSVAIQLVVIAAFMWQSLVGYVRLGGLGPFLTAETLVHHSLGLGVIVIWAWANLVMLGVLKHQGRLVLPMRIAFAMWMLSLALGVHVYLRIWVIG